MSLNGTWALAPDLPPWWIVAVAASASLALGLLLWELRYRERLGVAIVGTGMLATVALAAAVLRPAWITTRGTSVGPRVVVLMDESRRLDLPSQGTPRRVLAHSALDAIRKHFAGARLTVLGFDQGPPRPWSALDGAPGPSLPRGAESDLLEALRGIRGTSGESPQAVVVVSDGRLTRPGEAPEKGVLRELLGAPNYPVHTVAVVRDAPADASIRRILTAGAAVAHQPFALKIDVGCAGGLACERLPVTIRELRQGAEPALLAQGTAEFEDGSARLELTITLERAGPRVVEIAIDAPPGDQVAENNRRILTLDVTRDRIRLLHVAGRPTYDVRALRTWLKSDEAVDLVAFFILRDESDMPVADDAELALIPFPVDELFTQHLPSFDAVVLQDIDAVTYKIALYLPALARYVESGGGLIMVGGPSAFAGGRYADSALERVLPIRLDGVSEPFDAGDFVPTYTEAGRAAPALRGLVELQGNGLPPMPGANLLGAPRPQSIVLWQHPTRKVEGRPMPVLALGEAGDGRSIALGVDGTHGLAFSEFAVQSSGRAYGALWDGLLGWLMRDPRYEPARVELVRDCVAGEPAILRLLRIPGMAGDIRLSVERLGVGGANPVERVVSAPAEGPVEIPLGVLDAGGYTARVQVGAAPPARRDFACERGGEAWSDSRPDPDRLQRIAEATQGRAVSLGEIHQLPQPAILQVATERRMDPFLPPWATSLLAALALGGHWLARRRGGLP